MWDLCASSQESGYIENKFGNNGMFSTDFLLYNEIMLTCFLCFSTKNSGGYCAPQYLAQKFCPEESCKCQSVKPSLLGTGGQIMLARTRLQVERPLSVTCFVVGEQLQLWSLGPLVQSRVSLRFHLQAGRSTSVNVWQPLSTVYDPELRLLKIFY